MENNNLADQDIKIDSNSDVEFGLEYNPVMSFHDPEGNEVGNIDIRSNELTFSGNMDESAKKFFELLKEIFDPWIKDQLEKK